MRRWCGIVLAVMSAWPSAGRADGEKGPGPRLDPDEVEIEGLINQMGAPKYKVRAEAHEKLHALGPSVVPVLVKYRDHKNAEIAERVRNIIGDYVWMQTGVLVTKVKGRYPWIEWEKPPKRDSLGRGAMEKACWNHISTADRGRFARVGPDLDSPFSFQVGDVIVKVNGVNITRTGDLDPFWPEACDCVIWRGGRMIEHRTIGLPLNMAIARWDYARGGSDLARAVRLYAGREYREASARFRAACRNGMDDFWLLLEAAAMASYFLDRTGALEMYEAAMRINPQQDDLTLRGAPGLIYPEGWSDIDVCSDWLLKRLRDPAATKQERSWADFHFTFFSPNLAMSRRLADANWQGPVEHPYFLYQHKLIPALLAWYEGRWRDCRDAADAARKLPAADEASAWLSLLASLHLGDVDAACEKVVFHRTRWTFIALVAAAAAGRSDLSDKVLAGIRWGPRENRTSSFTGDDSECLMHAGVLKELGAAMRKLDGLKAQPAWRVWAYCPHFTEADLAEALLPYRGSDGQVPRWLYNRLYQPVLEMRWSKYESAKSLLAKSGRDAEPMKQAAELLAAKAARLDGDWAALKGTIAVYPAAEPGARWAVRWDGSVVHVDAGGKCREFPGIAPGQVHRPDRGERIVAGPDGTMYLKRSQVYLFDAAGGRWLRTWAAPHGLAVPKGLWDDPAAPAMLRHVTARYPPPATDRGELLDANAIGPWRFYRLRGNIGILVHSKTRRVVDLSAQIAAAAGADKPVAVYRPWINGDANAAPAGLFPTSAGLWKVSDEGQPSRIVLDPNAPNQAVRVMPGDPPKGKLYVGVVVEQGGKVYEVDLSSGAAAVTGGFCGRGPDDDFAWYVVKGRMERRGFYPFTGCYEDRALLLEEDAIQAIYERRH